MDSQDIMAGNPTILNDTGVLSARIDQSSATLDPRKSKIDELVVVERIECYPTPSANQALGALTTIRSHIQVQSHVNDNLFNAVNVLKNYMDENKMKNKKQKKMADYLQ